MCCCRPAVPGALTKPFSVTSECVVRPTFFRSAARGLQVPATLTPEPTKHEARKRRASVRPRVGCCEELGANICSTKWSDADRQMVRCLLIRETSGDLGGWG